MQIRLVTNSEEAVRCINFWHEVYRDLPCWVPPDRHESEAMLMGRNSAAADTQVQTFFVEDGDRIAASITAVRDETYVRHRNEQTGHLLCFEAFPGEEDAVRALMEAACGWLRERSCVAARLSLLPGWRLPLTIDGYDAPPTFFHVYNPPYYHGYIKSAGFVTEKGCVEYQVKFSPELAGRYQEMVKRALDSGVRLRNWDMDRLEEESGLFGELCNETFSSHWGFMPLTTALFDDLTVGLRDFLVRDFLVFAEVDGQSVGFVYALPDLNQALHALRSRPIGEDPSELDKLFGEVNHGVLLIIGVREAFRGRGINLAMSAMSYLAMMERGYKSASYTMVLDDNWPSRRTAEKLGAHVVRNFNVYRRELK